jgi:hypothetical protein
MNLIIEATIHKNIKMLDKVIRENGIYVNSEWQIIHYLVDNDWYDGIALYKIYLNGDINTLTTDFCGNTSGIPIFIIGGQNALFMAKSKQMITFLYELGIKEVIDNNGNNYHDYLLKKNDLTFHIENYKKIKNRLTYSWLPTNINEIIDIKQIEKNKIFSEYLISKNISEYLNLQEIVNMSVQNVNTMHKKSFNIIITDEIKQLVTSVLKKENINPYLIKNITGFIIEYSTETETKLNKHIDDSMYTINICLENSSDMKLIFDGIEFSVDQKSSHIYFHLGSIPHLVTTLTYGTKKNIILWIS